MTRKIQNVLVTGGCGFIASNFINYLHSTHPTVFVLNIDRLDYCSDVDNVICQDPSRYQLAITDINNKEHILKLFHKYNIDTVVHMAAQSHVDNSFGNSIQFTMDNVLGTHTLLECARVYGKLQLFLHISTDEVYGEVDLDHPGCDEKSLLNPTSPYASSKCGAEFVVRSYYHSFKLPVIITRGNNVYGPRQYPEKLIPKFISHFIKNEKCTIHGEGKSRRNFIYVDDVSRAVEKVMLEGEINQIYNIGSWDEYSVMDIFYRLHKELNIEKETDECIEYVEDRAFNDFRYAINSDKLQELGWNQQVSFDEGIRSTVEWYKQKLMK